MNFFKHDKALIDDGVVIGNGTRVWAFAHILSGAKIGENCNICDHTFIEGKVIVGNNVTVKCGVYIWDGVTIADNVFIGANVTFTNDKYPRSKKYPKEYAKTVIEKGASIGAGATLLPVRVGENAMIGTGSVVTKDVPANAIVMGCPAKVTGYVDTEKVTIPIFNGVKTIDDTLYIQKTFNDLRGNLLPIEFVKNIPFEVKRAFFVYGVESGNIRGEHAHKVCHQFLIAISGSISVICDDGIKREEYLLNDPKFGLYIKPGVWGVQYKYSKDAVLCVFASHEYDEDDYIRNYQDFLRYKNML